jgi:ribulose-phosphate 3-epimerase
MRRVQVDVLDGKYTPVGSWPYSGVEDIRDTRSRLEYELPLWHEYDFEVDLMVEHPEAVIEEWSLAGATAVVVHIETVSDMKEIIRLCEKRRLELGIALKPSTEIESILPFVESVLFVQFMGNTKLGTHGAELMRSVPEKIRTLKKISPQVCIGIDIGVREETVQVLCDAGVERFVAGSAVFGSDDPVGAYERLEVLVEKNIP